MSRQVPKSAGIEQRYEDFSWCLDQGYAALTSGIKGNQLGFDVSIDGEYIPRAHAQQANVVDVNTAKNRGPQVVPMPIPRQQQRDDLEMYTAPRPRPY